MVNLVFLISEKVDFETVGSGLGNSELWPEHPESSAQPAVASPAAQSLAQPATQPEPQLLAQSLAQSVAQSLVPPATQPLPSPTGCSEELSRQTEDCRLLPVLEQTVSTAQPQPQHSKPAVCPVQLQLVSPQ